MAKWMLVAGAAAIALTAPAMAGPDKGNGGAKGGGNGNAEAPRSKGNGSQKAERGGGGQKAERQIVRAERGNSGGKQAERRSVRDERGNGGVKQAERQMVRAERGDGNGKKADRNFARAKQRDVRTLDVREAERGSRVDDRFGGDNRSYVGGFGNFRDLSGLYGNCPPGLAKKGNGCLAPGQAKKMLGLVLPAAIGSQLLEGPYRQWYRDNDQYYYREDDDYIYRVNRNGGLVDAFFPYQDNDYSYYPVGMTYPSDFNYYNVPDQYQSYFSDGGEYNYRYGDGAIYQVNRSDNMISSIVALLAGDLGVGQRMPSDYGVYNVPMSYRDRYYDTAEASYRYNDGYIYQADPKTQLITAVISALV